jgi:thiol:disulfide interchange protein
MGAVLFAAGSMNLLMKPGPWMVWVRHGFGVIMVGAALFYLASAGLLSHPTGVLALGLSVAVLVGLGIARHLVKGQGQPVGAAASQSARVAVLVSAATLLVVLITKPASGDLTWTTITSREHVLAEVAAARREGKGTVIDVWATWCPKCKYYDKKIEDSKETLDAFRGLKRLRLDVTDDNFDSLRAELRIPRVQQPYMVFIDRDGFQRKDVVVDDDDQTAEQLLERVRKLSPSVKP